ncbi:hypothetical protein [Streptosporangium sp. NPDC049046]|uniref:hypothetical protein n=1 Tax=Streptosporangium sp. NPDC049046 TaxID=3155031 RepID=UPI003433B4A1
MNVVLEGAGLVKRLGTTMAPDGVRPAIHAGEGVEKAGAGRGGWVGKQGAG